MRATAERVAARIGSAAPGLRTLSAPTAVWVPAASIALVALAWPVPTLQERVTGLDTSWQIALQVAASEGLNHGEDFSFTYGPLGFLTISSLYVAGPAALAVAFAVVIQLVFAITLLLATRVYLAPPLAILTTYLVVAAPLPDHDLLTLIAFAWAVVLATGRAGPRGELPLAAGLGAAAAIGLLTKFNGGLTTVVVTALACALARAPLRAGAGAAGAFVVTGLAAWIATGNPIGNLPRWLADSVRLAGDYSESLALVIPGRMWTLYVAIALFIWLFHSGWRETQGWPRGRRLVAAALLGAFCFSFFKSGFVRHDGHELATFAALAVAPLAIATRVTRHAAVAASAAAIAAMLGVFDISPERAFGAGGVYDPAASLRQARYVLGTMRDDARRDEVIRTNRSAARAQLALGDDVLLAVRGRTVAVHPSEISAAWAYELDWRPLPSLQAYVAYPPALDVRNGRFLLSERRPERVLNHAPPTPFDSPEAYLAIVCGYREVVASATWQVLAPRGSSCASAEPLGSVTATAGELVSVPRAPDADAAVVARFLLAAPSLSDRLRTLVFRPPLIPSIELDTGRQLPFFTTTASHPHVMRTPRGWSSSDTFGAGADVSSFRLHGVAGSFRVEFFAVRRR